MLSITLSLIIADSYSYNKPHFPNIFYSKWNWYESYVDQIGAKGEFIWANNGTAMYYNITALKFEQLLVNNKVYNWYRNKAECYIWEVGFILLDHYFDNTSYIGSIDGVTDIWSGSLDTVGVFGERNNFIVYTNASTGLFGSKYVAVNALNDSDGKPGSEVMDLIRMEYELPNDSSNWFIVPSFCDSATYIRYTDSCSSSSTNDSSNEKGLYVIVTIVSVLLITFVIAFGFLWWMNKRQEMFVSRNEPELYQQMNDDLDNK